MTLTEPATMITDYVLGLAGLLFGWTLIRTAADGARSRLLWSLGFFCGSTAAIIGGTFHGFAAYQSAAVHKLLWDVTMALIGACAAFMAAAALSSPLRKGSEHTRWLQAGLWLSIAGLAIQKAGISVHPSFNNNDLFHCLQTVAFYLFFRGARLIP